MRRLLRRLYLVAPAAILVVGGAPAQTLTWEQVRDRFIAANPSLRAGQLNIEESKASEVTAYLRPNPDLTLTTDGTQISRYQGVWRPLAGTDYGPNLSYLHERRQKRELRLESAQQGTSIAQSQLEDMQRTLLFTLRSAFVQTLQAKELLRTAKENLDYFEKQLGINQDRFKAGDIARVDLDRLVLQRVQYQSDYQAALTNARTSKITLQMLLNDRSAHIDQFDVSGPYDFSPTIAPLEEFRNIALSARPDLRAAVEAIRKAEVDHKLAVANGSADPTFSLWWTHNPSFNNPYDNNTLGASVMIPLRIFDRNQGEKARTEIDIQHARRQKEAAEAQVFNDVDSAYYTLVSAVDLLRPYKGTDGYLETAVRIREIMSFSYQHGQAALVDYLDAQREYRATEVSYINLVGSYLTAAGQLSLAVGREVAP
jgi:cobalt-zinc-cadmium efflux system outer membrane protein